MDAVGPTSLAFIPCHGYPILGSWTKRTCDANNNNTTQSYAPKRQVVRALLSEPFVRPELLKYGANALFEPFPHIVFSPAQSSEIAHLLGIDIRPPELVGTILWAFALYFGFAENMRWGSALQFYITQVLEKRFPFLGPVATGETSAKRRNNREKKAEVAPSKADLISTAIHTFPFFLGGVGMDALLRATLGDVWALSTGTTAMLWSFVYELGRLNAGRFMTDKEFETEQEAYSRFLDFSVRNLKNSGRCHFSDISNKFWEENPTLKRQITDQQLKRFIRRYHGSARVSSNGFYKGLSLTTPEEKAARIEMLDLVREMSMKDAKERGMQIPEIYDRQREDTDLADK